MLCIWELSAYKFYMSASFYQVWPVTTQTDHAALVPARSRHS